MKGTLMNKIIQPDWAYWSKLSEVSLWNALLLAQDLCPNNYVPGQGIDDDHDVNYHRRLSIAHEQILSKSIDWVTVRGPSILEPQQIMVSLPKFVKWYLECITTRVPDEFKRMYIDGYNLSGEPIDYVKIGREIGLRIIEQAPTTHKLTQDVLAKKIAVELEMMGILGSSGGVLSDGTIRAEVLTKDGWYKRVKRSPNKHSKN